MIDANLYSGGLAEGKVSRAIVALAAMSALGDVGAIAVWVAISTNPHLPECR